MTEAKGAARGSSVRDYKGHLLWCDYDHLGPDGRERPCDCGAEQEASAASARNAPPETSRAGSTEGKEKG